MCTPKILRAGKNPNSGKNITLLQPFANSQANFDPRRMLRPQPFSSIAIGVLTTSTVASVRRFFGFVFFWGQQVS